PAKRTGTRPAERKPLPADVASWTVGQVLSWLSEEMQLPKYVHKFRAASVDGLVLCDLTDDLLREGLSISDPLHRLKVLRHVQKLGSQRQQHRHHNRYYHPKKDKAENCLCAPKEFEATKAAGPSGSRPRPEGGGNLHLQLSATLSEKETHIKPMARSSQRSAVAVDVPARHVGKTLARRDLAEKSHQPHLGLRLDVMTDEQDFANTMNEVRSELVFPDPLGEFKAVGSPLAKRSRKLPGNATTGEVYEVVRTAMWETAALLEEHESTYAARHEGDHDRDDASFRDSGIERAEPGAHPHARLLFDKLCSFQQDGTRSLRPQGGSKLTRHRLEAGIRFLLQLEMRWEQWQLFLDSVSCLRTQGYLSLDNFSKAFGGEPAVEATAKKGGTELREFVLGIADSLRACQQTLGFVISKYVRRDARKISVSEFVSLIKALTGKKKPGTEVGGFGREQAYNLLRCVDKDGDRRVALRDLVAFVFATWTEELNRL
ncbi:unnamed protein product, partial [Hapterophycus canaliculatus]